MWQRWKRQLRRIYHASLRLGTRELYLRRGLSAAALGFRHGWTRFLYLPTVAARRFLQLFVQSLGASRHAMHLSIAGLALILSLSGLVNQGAFGSETEGLNRYVQPSGTGSDSVRYASMMDDGYLAKSNNAATTIKAKRTQGIQDYVVQPGDTVSSIAYRFGITQKTIQWANQLQDISRLKPGDTLTILPASGVLHKVEDGQDVGQIASKYAASSDDLIAANDLVAPVKLITDQEIVVPLSDDKIPDMPKPEPVRPTASVASSSAASSASGGGGLTVVQPAAGSASGSGSFIWPAAGRVTQNFYQHRWGDGALDIASRALPPIYASDDGVVTISGWDSSGYGRRIDIDHGNGFVTRYAHNSELYVSAGQRVTKGQVIAKMGCTGYCSGPHVHFMIIRNGVPVNPYDYL